MTADDDSLDDLLRKRYYAELRKRLVDFGTEIGLSIENPDALSRLFVRFGSMPAYEPWRKDVLREELAETREPSLLPNQPAQADSRLRAVQILGGERMTKAEWGRAMDWAKAHGGRRLKDGSKWNLTEEEMQEALR